MYGDPLMNNEAPRVAHAALVAGVPTVGMSREVAQAGLLMSYGPRLPALFGRAAVYVDKILRGTPPAEIPVERPRAFELIPQPAHGGDHWAHHLPGALERGRRRDSMTLPVRQGRTHACSGGLVGVAACCQAAATPARSPSTGR